jgi:hypothetical protein
VRNDGDVTRGVVQERLFVAQPFLQSALHPGVHVGERLSATHNEVVVILKELPVGSTDVTEGGRLELAVVDFDKGLINKCRSVG